MPASEDAAATGRSIYNEKIRDTLGSECRSKIVVIDVHGGDYEIADKDIEATNRGKIVTAREVHTQAN